MTTEKVRDNEWVVFDDRGFNVGSLIYEEWGGSYNFFPAPDIGLDSQELVEILELMDA